VSSAVAGDDRVDLLVIGAGSAGLVAAKTAARLGASVVVVEKARPGGDCLWTGCVPSKALLAAAHRAHAMRDAARFGLQPVHPQVDFAAVMAHVHAASAALEPPDSPQALRAAGITVVEGSARFCGPDTVMVAGRAVRFRWAVIATGATAALPPVDGLAELAADAAGVMTSETVWGLEELPGSLLVLGAGPIGCELGQAFARLGTRVTLIEAASRVLPGEEPAASAALHDALTRDGVQVRTDAPARELRRGHGGLVVDLESPSGAASETVQAERVLVAAGRRPDLDGLDPAAAGVRVGSGGQVAVDRRLRTSNSRIYAAGDVTGGLAFTHVAGTQGSIAATNALLAPLRRLDPDRVPWVTFTDPEVAHVGPTEQAARRRYGPGVHTRRLDHDRVDRAVTDADTRGFTHVVLDRWGRVLAATVVAARAGEMLSELTALVARRGRLRELAGIVHPYPSWADGPWNTALGELAEAMTRPLPARLARVALAARRSVPSRR